MCHEDISKILLSVETNPKQDFQNCDWLGAVGKYQILGQSKLFERPDGHVGHVNLPPRHPVTGGTRHGVMVVVPAFAVGQDGRPPEIGRVVTGFMAAVAPLVTSGVGEPGAVVDDDGTNKNAVDHKRPATNQKEQTCKRKLQKQHVLVQKAIDRIPCEIFGKAGVVFVALMLLGHLEDPTHVAPPKSFVGIVGIATGVGVGMVHPVIRNPVDGAALHTEGAKQGQKIFEGLRDTKTAMAQHPMKTKGDPQTTQSPMQKECQQQS